MRRLFRVGADRHDTGRVVFAWHPDGNYLASAGKNTIIQITDRHGDIVEEIPMVTQSPILSLQWDKDGDILAILQEGNGIVPLWSLSTRKIVPLETNLREPTFISWSKTGPQLAIGTAKGNLLIYNKTKKQKIPIVGKHGRRINCGSWSKGSNKLVLGSDDRTITVSNENGDTLLHFEVKNIPLQVLFTYQRSLDYSSAGQGNGDNTISSNLNGKSIVIYNILNDNEEPMELTFPTVGGVCKYGEIVSHEWIDEGLILVGFSIGYLVLFSSGKRDLGEEKFAAKFHSNNFITYSYNRQLKRVASAGDDGVRIFNISDFRESKEDYISPEDLEGGKVTTVEWSPDGQILSISTNAGNVYNFLAKMNVISTRYKTSIAYLSSLREVSIVDTLKRSRPIDVTLKLEPTVIALGGKYVAAGMNNRVYFHRIATNNESSRGQGNGMIEQEYMTTVKEIQLNDTHCVVLLDSKAILHPIEPVAGANSLNNSRTFPSREEGSFSKVNCVALCDNFLYYGTEAGTVEVFYLSEWVLLPGAELRIDRSVKQIFPNSNGTRVVVIDSSGQSFLFNPVTGGGVNASIIKFEDAPLGIVDVIWDFKDKNTIILNDGKSMHTYIYVCSSMKGGYLLKLGPMTVSGEGQIEVNPEKIDLPSGNSPLICIGGIISSQSVSGLVSYSVHPLFDHIVEQSNLPGKKNRSSSEKIDKKYLTKRFTQSLAALQLDIAWLAAVELDRRQYWLALGGKAMELLQIELACRVYRQLGDAGMVMALQECLQIEDTMLLAGQVALLFSDYQRAQELFLVSSSPSAALMMRRDLLQWDQALKLAQALNSKDIADIYYNYGLQLELRGEADAALKNFEAALNAQDTQGRNICPESIAPLSMMGVARCNIQLGNIRPGIRLANELDDSQLYIDCGDLLEQQKQYSEAASLYQKAQQFEKVAQMYIKYLIKADKNRINEATSIMEKVKNDQLNIAFAKLCVSAGRYSDACKAYERASDMDKVIEMKLRYLDQAQDAFDLVRQSSSAQGAQLVADYCIEHNDYRGAMEFMLIANKSEEAFKLAQTNGIVEVYAGFLGDHMSSEDALRVANFYEKTQDYGKAGRYYSMCGHYSRALKLFIQCGDREIDSAIEVVGKSQNDSLIHQLLDFLAGEKDGIPKDSSYIYRLHMALKRYSDAAKTAIIIAKQEQEMGNYTMAHSVVVEIIQHLENAKMKVPLQLRQMFILLHSYKLVKLFVRQENHENAARLLLRIAQNSSSFPSHVVPILTSTVIECHRAGLKATAYGYAVTLMAPEYRQAIDVAIRRRIEAIVRRKSASQGEEIPEGASPCPVSKIMLPNYQLESPTTKDALPMCIVTGRHLILNDWCFCPNSRFPAIYSEYVRYIEHEIALQKPTDESLSSTESVLDPIVGKPIQLSDLKLCPEEEALKYIQIYNNNIEEATPAPDSSEPGSPSAPDQPSSVRVKRRSGKHRRGKKN